MLIADIFMTTHNRPHLLRATLASLRNSTPRQQYRLTLVSDCAPDVSFDEVAVVGWPCDHILINFQNRGLGPSMNMALAHIDALRRWDEIPPLVTVYVQDDVVFADGWLEKLSTKFLQLERPLNLAFASGHNAVEHPTKKDLGGGMILKDWIRATCMMARHETWMSMWPIPKVDPETGRERGRPHDGLGSGVDWHFVRVHPKSGCRNGKTNLVMPGLVMHAGFAQSSWLKRDLPESEADKHVIQTVNPFETRTIPKIKRDCDTCGKTMTLPSGSQTTECSRCLDF